MCVLKHRVSGVRSVIKEVYDRKNSNLEIAAIIKIFVSKLTSHMDVYKVAKKRRGYQLKIFWVFCLLFLSDSFTALF